MDKPSKVLITGTGRAGTTFLMIILTKLELDTGFTNENYQGFMKRECKAGLETKYLQDSQTYIAKNPNIMLDIEKIQEVFNVEHIIIPIRNLKESAKSRNNLGVNKAGGLWYATDYESQLQFYYKIMAEYLHSMVKYDIPTTFLCFEKMTKDPQYLYNKLSFLLKDIPFEKFLQAYQEASEHYSNKM